MPTDLGETILQIIKDSGPLSSHEIITLLRSHYHIAIEKEELNSLLYGQLHEMIIRDKDEDGYPTWRIRGKTFEAAKGLEVKFFNELLKQRIITEKTAQLDFVVINWKKGKTYHLDIAVFQKNKKVNIEIDGFDHLRADAMASVQYQLEKKGEDAEIEIDWMDHEKSYVDFKKINHKRIYKWCTTHAAWAIHYHEELIWPSDITRNVFLIENGWQVIRFWNFEIGDDMKRCIREVKELLSD